MPNELVYATYCASSNTLANEGIEKATEVKYQTHVDLEILWLAK